MTDRASAQGLQEVSLTGENVAEQLRQSSDSQPDNLKVGPVGLRIEADMSTAYNTNINLTKTAPTADVIFTPSVTLSSHWAVTDLNTLDFTLGLGYQAYLSHSEADCLLISPDTEARFNFFVGEVQISLHDSFSYQQDPTQIGQLSNTTRLSRFTNDAGVGASWDLNPFTVSLSYDHTNFWVINSGYDYLSNQSDTISPSVTYIVNPSVSVGLNGSFSDVRYEQNVQNDNTTVTIGPFIRATLSNNLTINGQFGAYLANYNTGGSNGDTTSSNTSVVGSVGLSHRINSALQESFEAGREYLPGLTTNYTERLYAEYTATWQATNYLNVGGSVIVENFTDSNGPEKETSNRYGLGLNILDNLTERTTLNLNYQYLLKDANPSDLGYEQNVGTVGFGYHF